MNFKKISIIALCVLMMISFVMTISVNAEEIGTFALPTNQQKETVVNITSYTFDFNAEKKAYLPKGYTDYFVLKNVSNRTYPYAICYYSLPETETSGQIQIYGNYWCFEMMLCLEFTTDEAYITFMSDPNTFNNRVYRATISSSYPDGSPKIAKGDTSNIIHSSSEYTITQTYKSTSPYTQTIPEEQYVKISANPLELNTDTGNTDTDDKLYKDGVLGWFQRIFDKIAEIPNLLGTLIDIINPFKQNESIILDKAGELINDKLADNKFFTSIITIRNSLKDLYNEDYSSRTGFYELGLTNITLRKPKETIYIDQGNEVIGPWEQEVGELQGTIDFGLNNVKVLNLDWYFGRDLGGGKYTKGMKPYIDNLISAFLWVMFAWALYKNMPNWISGELTQISNLTTEVMYVSNKKIKTNTNKNTKETKQTDIQKLEGRKSFNVNPKLK